MACIRRREIRLRTAVLAALVATTSCSSRPHVTVGSKNFSEQVVLGEILAQQIERRLGVPVERRFYLGGTLLAHEGLKTDSIDLYPEYTGTALTAVLKRPVSRDAGAVLASVREGYRQWNLSWLDPLGFNNTFAMVVRSDLARARNIRTLTDAAGRSEPWRLGVGYEFVTRPDGLKGLLSTYHLRMNGTPLAMDLGLLYPALENQKIEMGAANATDGQLARPEFTMLEDDRRYFPPYECAVVVRDETLAKFPRLREVLQELSSSISDDAMRRMNAAVDRDKKAAAAVAREFLVERQHAP